MPPMRREGPEQPLAAPIMMVAAADTDWRAGIQQRVPVAGEPFAK
jgi:hypothetical protein